MSEKKNLKVVEKDNTVEEKQIPAENEKITTDVGVEQAPPSNIYQVLMARMTPQQLANMGVQMVQVNGAELFWMTSVGQLYPFNNKQGALEAEYAWLLSKPN